MKELLRDLWKYLMQNKKWWLVPLMITLLLVGFLLFLAASTALYALIRPEATRCVPVTGSTLCISSVFSAAGDRPGATDSTSPNMEVVKATYYTSHLFILSPIDTTKIDRIIWLPVHNKDE